MLAKPGETDQQRYDKLVESCKKHMSTTPHVIDGMEFWYAGCNATHQFYVGKLGEFFLRYSVGEGYWDDVKDYDTKGEPPSQTNLSVFGTFDELARTYLGHF